MRTVEEVSIPDLDLEAMQAVLEDAPVAVAVLYGSDARGEAAARGDVEVAVGLEERLSGLDRVGARVDLADELDRVAEPSGTDVIPLSTALECSCGSFGSTACSSSARSRIWPDTECPSRPGPTRS